MNERKKLSDIIQKTELEKLNSKFRQMAAAEEFSPIPPGEYTFRVLSGELFTSKNGTAGFKLKLQVTQGDFEGRLAWHDLWLTENALPMTKRDLAKLGIRDLSQLETPFPNGILIRAKLALRTDDKGNESNQIKRFEFVEIEPGLARFLSRRQPIRAKPLRMNRSLSVPMLRRLPMETTSPRG